MITQAFKHHMARGNTIIECKFNLCYELSIILNYLNECLYVLTNNCMPNHICNSQQIIINYSIFQSVTVKLKPIKSCIYLLK